MNLQKTFTVLIMISVHFLSHAMNNNRFQQNIPCPQNKMAHKRTISELIDQKTVSLSSVTLQSAQVYPPTPSLSSVTLQEVEEALAQHKKQKLNKHPKDNVGLTNFINKLKSDNISLKSENTNLKSEIVLQAAVIDYLNVCIHDLKQESGALRKKLVERKASYEKNFAYVYKENEQNEGTHYKNNIISNLTAELIREQSSNRDLQQKVKQYELDKASFQSYFN